MNSLTASEARAGLYRLIDQAAESHQPILISGKRSNAVLISADADTLKKIVKHLSGISDADITGLEIPTGQPIVYELDEALNATDRYYLSER